MAAVVSLVVVVTLILLVTRVATVALTMTGMSLDHARFQARSAFTGTGFTTAEAEAVVSHPARRRIVMTLMLVSGAGRDLGARHPDPQLRWDQLHHRRMARAGLIVAALAVLLWLAHNRVVDRALRQVIERVLRRVTDLEVRDYAALLHLRGQWRVAQLPVGEDDWIASRPLGELRLPEEGVAVLGVERAEGIWIGAPREDLQLRVGDVVVLYAGRPCSKASPRASTAPTRRKPAPGSAPGTPPAHPRSPSPLHGRTGRHPTDEPRALRSGDLVPTTVDC